MASLLVRVGREVLDAFDARADHRRTTLRPGELAQPELAHADRTDVVFVTWLDAERLRIGATIHEPELDRDRLVGGDVLLHDHDITHLRLRLGCAGALDAWSARPRVLPPNDVDLLRYELALPVDPRKKLIAEPVVLAPEDEIDRRLLADVWANPSSDEPRMIYADRLQQRADPRGELIALQLARGDGPSTVRERQLLSRWAGVCARPLAEYLAAFELRRGFLSRVVVDDRTVIPRSLIDHPAWTTIEEIQSSTPDLLMRAPLHSAKIARLATPTMFALAHADRALPFHTVLGHELLPGSRYSGLTAGNAMVWTRVAASEAWSNLRVLSIQLAGAMTLASILRTPLGERLEHLDLVVDPGSEGGPSAQDLHAELAYGQLQRITLLAQFDPVFRHPVTLAYVRDDRGGHSLMLQVGAHDSSHGRAIVRWVAPHSRDIRRIEVHDLGRPVKTRERHAELLRLLSPLVREVIAVDTAQPPLCPWAYSVGLPSAPIP